MAPFSGVAVFAAAAFGLISGANAQAGPNTLARYNPGNRTMSVNSTICILPITKSAARTITGHEPLTVPQSILPGFPADMHPLIAQIGYNNDIRQTPANLIPLQIASLMSGSISVPYTDVTGDGRTPIAAFPNAYIGGTAGQDLQALVPAIASTFGPLEGSTLFPARFSPDTAAAQPLPAGLFSAQVKPYLLPNQITGPGVYAEAFDMLYRLTQAPRYTARTFHNLVNQPRLLNTGMCQRNPTYFNQTFTNPQFAVGNVTLYHQILVTPPAEIEGDYNGVECYQANGVNVAGFAEPCAVAAALSDPAASE